MVVPHTREQIICPGWGSKTFGNVEKSKFFDNPKEFKKEKI